MRASLIPLLLTAAISAPTLAQDYPSKTITITLVLAAAAQRPGLEAVSWHALVAPSATPRAVVNRLHGEMARILKTPEVNKAIVNLDLIPAPPMSIEENQQYIAAEARKWGDLIRKLGLAGSQ